MRYLFTVLILLATGMSAHSQARSDETQRIVAEDKALIAECRLFLLRPDLRTPTLRKFVTDALQGREVAWTREGDANDIAHDLTVRRAMVKAICNEALVGAPISPPSAPAPPPPTASNTDTAGWVAREPPGAVAASMQPAREGGRSGRHAGDDSGSPSVEHSPHQAPQIEPWPPPVPTDQATFAVDRTKLKTVGSFADALMLRLNDAGIRHLRFWGAPNGVAVVAPLEAIDENARPLRANASASDAATEKGGPLSMIFEGFRHLLSGPIRDSRILLFVLTTDSKANSPAVPMTAEIARQWTQNDYMRPDVNRSVKLTEQHFVVVDVYEFRKDNEGDPALLTEGHKRHSVIEHLAASQLDVNGLLK